MYHNLLDKHCTALKKNPLCTYFLHTMLDKHFMLLHWFSLAQGWDRRINIYNLHANTKAFISLFDQQEILYNCSH
jgi:hypothetical protein